MPCAAVVGPEAAIVQGICAASAPGATACSWLVVEAKPTGDIDTGENDAASMLGDDVGERGRSPAACVLAGALTVPLPIDAHCRAAGGRSTALVGAVNTSLVKAAGGDDVGVEAEATDAGVLNASVMSDWPMRCSSSADAGPPHRNRCTTGVTVGLSDTESHARRRMYLPG